MQQEPCRREGSRAFSGNPGALLRRLRARASPIWKPSSTRLSTRRMRCSVTRWGPRCAEAPGAGRSFPRQRSV
eukprot:10163749-Lingulodinium_polyedra.AAC.1